MARYTASDALAAITAVLNNHNGVVTHNDLVQELEASGNGKAVSHVLSLYQNGALQAEVVAQAVGKPVLSYRLGGNS